MEAKIRKYQNILGYSGYAFIAFGLWSILRLAIMLYFNRSLIRDMLPQEELVTPEVLEKWVYVTLVVFIFVDQFIRIYTGLSAVAVSQGRHRRIAYIVLSVLYMIFTIGSDVQSVIAYPGRIDNNMVTVTIIDITSCIACYEIARCALAIRRLERREAQEGHHAA